MLTEPMEHQIKGLRLLEENSEFFALLCEQGTGKTWMALADAERKIERGEADALFVLAPKGVHSNWVRREIPRHIGDKWDAAYWVPEKTKKAERIRKRIMDSEEPVIFTMNIDAINTERGFAFAKAFLKSKRAVLVLDESTRIKSPTAGRSKRAVQLSPMAVARRILSGTIMPNGPTDLFMQAEFLLPEGKLLGTYSYRAFVAEFCDLLPESSPLYQAILQQTRGRGRPQIVARDSNGKRKYKNLDKLTRLMSTWCYRVTKDECLDLPPKIYTTMGFDLSPKQQAIYKSLEDDLRVELDGQLQIFERLVVASKLRQVVSCFLMVDGEPTTLMEDNPRLMLLKEIIEDTDGSVIIWACFRAEIAAIGSLLDSMNISYREYHGGVNKDNREAAVDDFQSGKARVFLGNPQAAGIGLTLTAANTVIYYSNDYNLENRLQSEDRAHRIGTTGKVLYIDIVANDTIDESVVDALQSKADVQESVMKRLS